MNKIMFDIMQNVDDGYSSKEIKEAYKRYSAQKDAPHDVALKFDEKELKKMLDEVFTSCGFTVE